MPPPQFPFDFGGWRVLRLLGRGGMGAVYEAEQRDTGRRVALKVLGQAIDSPEMRKRFLREGRLAASVNHPNSVYIFGTEEIDGAPVIAMELVAGGTLKDALRKKPLPSREAVDAILQIIDGLEAAHAGGVLHRDVKPATAVAPTPDGEWHVVLPGDVDARDHVSDVGDRGRPPTGGGRRLRCRRVWRRRTTCRNA